MKTMLSIWSPPPVSKGYQNMRSRVDDPIRLEPEQTLSNILSSLSAWCTCADDAANGVPGEVEVTLLPIWIIAEGRKILTAGRRVYLCRRLTVARFRA